MVAGAFKGWALPLLNILSSMTAIYVFNAYGSLCTWWSRIFRESPALQGTRSTFHQVADSIHIGVIVLLVFNLGAAMVMERHPSVSHRLSLLSIAFAATALAITILVSF